VETPLGFAAVGEYYQSFEQTTDSEVKGLMAKAKKK
jgi:predicted phosphoribosyltransferase